MQNIKFTLTFTGAISPNGGDPEANGIAMTEAELQASLEQVVKNALNNGVVTGDTPATLEDHSFSIIVERDAS